MALIVHRPGEAAEDGAHARPPVRAPAALRHRRQGRHQPRDRARRAAQAAAAGADRGEATSRRRCPRRRSEVEIERARGRVRPQRGRRRAGGAAGAGRGHAAAATPPAAARHAAACATAAATASPTARRRPPRRPPSRRGRPRCRASSAADARRRPDPMSDPTSAAGRRAGHLHLAPGRAARRGCCARSSPSSSCCCASCPWAKDIYALLAAPLLQVLPTGATMIATDVTGTFFVPLKVTLMAAFLLALPYVLWQVWAFVAPGPLPPREAAGGAGDRVELRVLPDRHVVRVLRRVPDRVRLLRRRTRRRACTMMTDIDKYLSFVLTMFIAFGVTFEVPVVVIVLVRLRMVLAGEAARDPLLRDRRGVRRRRHLHAAGRGVAAAARGAAVAALRVRASCWRASSVPPPVEDERGRRPDARVTAPAAGAPTRDVDAPAACARARP